MIDFTTALHIAQTVLSPLQQALLQQIGKQAAAALTDRLAKLQEQIFTFIAGTQPGLDGSTSTSSALNQDPEALAAQILLAARRDPESFNEILQQYKGFKFDLNESHSTGAISAFASGSSSITQNVILGGNVHIASRQQSPACSSRFDTECSAQAKELLCAAALCDGEVLRVLLLNGPVIQAGGRNFIDSNNPSVRAKWEAAICELQDLGFLTRPLNPKDEILHVTQKGFEYIDQNPPQD